MMANPLGAQKLLKQMAESLSTQSKDDSSSALSSNVESIALLTRKSPRSEVLLAKNKAKVQADKERKMRQWQM